MLANGQVTFQPNRNVDGVMRRGQIRYPFAGCIRRESQMRKPSRSEKTFWAIQLPETNDPGCQITFAAVAWVVWSFIQLSTAQYS